MDVFLMERFADMLIHILCVDVQLDLRVLPVGVKGDIV